MTQSIKLIAPILLLGVLSCGVEQSTTVSNPEETTTTVAISKGVTYVDITFKDEQGTSYQSFSSNELDQYQQFLDVVSNKNAPEYKCGYSGEMIYTYEDGTTLSMEFNLAEDCNHIVYMQDNKLISKELTEEGRTALLGLMEKGERIVTQIEAPMIPEKATNDMEKLTGHLMERLKKNDQKDMYAGGVPDETIINHFEFQPNEYSAKYLLVQVILKRGEVTQDEFVYYYPGEGGDYTETDYFVVSDEDRPCDICDLTGIEVPTDKDPIASFTDRSTGKEFQRTMGYNLEEISFYWIND